MEEDNIEAALEELNSLVGLESVKKQVQAIKDRALFNQLLEEKGMTPPALSYHMAFTGNPGTGKTTVARILGKIFKNLGITSSDKFVEADRSALVGSYVGQTAPKTLDVCKSAYGGILFIDEAYSLADGGPNDFGKEARAFFERLTSTQASRVVQTRPDDIFAISKEDVVKTLGGCQ